MENITSFDSTFEPALVKEMLQFGELKYFKEGDIIMDYGKYVRMMPIIIKGTVKVYRKDESGNELLLYYLSSNESCSMAYSCCVEAKKSEVKAIAEDDVELK
jgi:CRP/FNR family transcriptional regulator